MLSRFELFVVLRNQIRDRARVRRALAVEAAMGALSGMLGEDRARWELAGLGASIGDRMAERNDQRRGVVAEELLLTEGAPADVAAAARERLTGTPEEMSRLSAGLVVAESLVDSVFESLGHGMDEEDDEIETSLRATGTLDDLDGRLEAVRLRRAAERRGDPAATRVLACAGRLGLELDEAGARVVDAMRAVREDLVL